MSEEQKNEQGGGETFSIGSKLTRDDVEALRSLRERGCAMVVWEPEELQGTPVDIMEERSIEIGWDIIDQFKDPNYRCGEGGKKDE